jgi:D-inositol-3-phosphate glycosyltransferase
VPDRFKIDIDAGEKMTRENLRIAMLSAHSCPVGKLGAKDTGGMSVYIRELAKELGKQGHPVDIYTRSHDPADPQIIYLGHGARLIHLMAGEDNDIHKLALYCYLPEFTCNLENFRRENLLEYDIVFSHYWLSTWAGAYLKQWWQVPHVAMFHTLGLIKNSIGIGEEEPELRIVTERESVNSCQRIIVSTKEEKEAIARLYGASSENIGVVPCGVNMEQFRPTDRKTAKRQLGLDNNVVLFVGRIDPLKGVEQLMKSVAYLREFDGLKLVIIGGDEDSQGEIDRLKKLSYETGIADKVDFRGMIKHTELPLYYNAADVCVVPSYYESFGLVALESLACGTPVLATDVGNLRNIIQNGETGYIIKGNSPQILASGIARVLAEPGFRDKPASAMRESISNYSWANTAEMITGELRTALSRQPVETC